MHVSTNYAQFSQAYDVKVFSYWRDSPRVVLSTIFYLLLGEIFDFVKYVGLFRLVVCLLVCLFVRSSTAQTAGPVVLKFLHLIGNPPETVSVQTPS